jgi:hypothetical protein
MALFSNKQEANLRSCTQMVEQSIASLGHDPDDSRIDTPEGPTWRVRKGSALVTVAILPGPHASDGENQLQVSADVIRLDERVDRLHLFQRLLELNVSSIKGAAFGLRNETIVLTAERSTVDLDRSELDDVLARVQEYADHFDDALVEEFGGRRAGL